MVAEAAREGLSLELVRMEPTPILICDSPDRANRRVAQVFDVHLIMPHDDVGTLTEGVYTIDADDAEDFADQLYNRTFPELRPLLARFSGTTVA